MTDHKFTKCKCGSIRIVEFWAVAKDNCELYIPHLNLKKEGYTPSGFGLGTGGDGAKIEFCLDCGLIQGFTPVSDQAVYKSLEDGNMADLK